MPSLTTTYRVVLAVFIALLPVVLSAQDKINRAIPTPGVTETSGNESKPASDLKTQRLDQDLPELYVVNHSAAAEPQPALKYRLYPSRGELKPGNSTTPLYRVLLLLKDRGLAQKQQFQEFMNSLEKPIAEYSDPEIQKQVREIMTFESVIVELERAVFREETVWDWQMTELEGTEPIEFLIPEAQESRELARVLFVMSRLAAATGDYEEAIKLNLMNLRVSEMIADPPTLINNLVGVAMSSLSLVTLRDMIAQTDCPNLYWALATIPDTFISMNQALEYEASLPFKIFPVLKDPFQTEHSTAEWARLMRQIVQNLDDLNEGVMTSATGTGLLGAGMLVRSYPVAKRELIFEGWDRVQIERMPVGQVVAIYQRQVTRSIYDEFMKWSYTSYQQRQNSLRFQADQKRFQQERTRMREPYPIADLLLPSVLQAKEAEVRMTAKIKGLMVLEAIRMHVDENEGELPNSLDEITVVPVPKVCPITGESFEYQKNGGRCVPHRSDYA